MSEPQTVALRLVPAEADVVAYAGSGNGPAPTRHDVATASSCTSGLVGHLITGTSGSSDYFAGGAIVYSCGQGTSAGRGP
ncbi:MAG: CinA family protein [Caldilineaceae bacterium]